MCHEFHFTNYLECLTCCELVSIVVLNWTIVLYCEILNCSISRDMSFGHINFIHHWGNLIGLKWISKDKCILLTNFISSRNRTFGDTFYHHFVTANLCWKGWTGFDRDFSHVNSLKKILRSIFAICSSAATLFVNASEKPQGLVVQKSFCG